MTYFALFVVVAVIAYALIEVKDYFESDMDGK